MCIEKEILLINILIFLFHGDAMSVEEIFSM